MNDLSRLVANFNEDTIQVLVPFDAACDENIQPRLLLIHLNINLPTPPG